MQFRTRLDYSNNRQIKQHPETLTILSGATSFGLTFSGLTTGPDLNTSAITQTYYSVVSTFSGNNTTTNYNWYDSRMALGEINLTALTPTYSASTQQTGPIFSVATTTVIDGNTVNLTYTGVSFDVIATSMNDLGCGNYSGTVLTNILEILSANTLGFTSRTIWADVSGITRTERLIITKNPQIGNVWTCIDSEGMGEWSSISSGNTFWEETGISNTALKDNKGNHSISGVSNNSIIAGGSVNFLDGTYYSGMLAGQNNIISGGSGNVILGGYLNKISGHTNSGIIGGSGNTIDFDLASSYKSDEMIIGSRDSSISSTTMTSVISSSASSINYGSWKSSIICGTNNHMYQSYNSLILGGENVTIGVINSNTNNVIVLGCNNFSSNTISDMVIVPDISVLSFSGTGSDPIAIDINGKIIAGTSDRRLKQNINKLTNSLSIINRLKGVSFEYTNESNFGSGTRYGFIAQDVQEIIPEIVRPRAGGDGFLSLNYNEIVPLLVEAVKELTSGITTTGNTYLITDADGNFVTNNDFKPQGLTIPLYTPTSSNDTSGSEGNITRDNNYLYIKTNDKWGRLNLETF